MFSNGCGTDQCTNTINIVSEVTRIAGGGTGSGATFLATITKNNRCSVTFNCPTTVDVCYLNFTNTAAQNMRTFILYNSTATTQLDI